jgi:hypothetical protein
MPTHAQILLGYLDAKERVIDAGYGPDVLWAEDLQHVTPDPQYVLREFAWVVVNSGFRYQVARKLWPRLLKAFHDFNPQKVNSECLGPGLKVLNHRRKLEAIIKVAGIIREEGIWRILQDSKEPRKLTRLPWIGPTTCWHLAKVLGADAIKPDVHLQRAAKAAGFSEAIELARAIQNASGETLTVIDSVLWRYGEQRVAQKWPDWPDLWCIVEV